MKEEAMNKLTIPLLVIILVILSGCVSMTQTTDNYVATIEVAKENAVKIAKISDFQTCFIRTCLGSQIDELSHKITTTLDDIDRLMKKIGTDYDNMTDCQKGKVLALWTRLITLGVLDMVKAINPGILTGLL
jgi:PBP1b-binding outer membrane lipoprotein LpoB